MSVDRRALLAALAASAAGAALGAPAPQPRPRADDEPPAREASWYRKLPDAQVECGLCPRACRVDDGERGFCGVRENRRGTYLTLVHGRACSVHVDPIEKKPFFHVLPGERALSFATAGCNVECKFCQNWEISQFRPEQVTSVPLPPAELAAAATRASARLVCATYSEPVVFWEYVRDTAREARRAGLRMSVVSNGFIQEGPLKEVLPLLAAVKIDLKSFREGFYRDVVRGELKPVLATLERVRAASVWLEIVMLVVPTLNDSEQEIRDLAGWVKANLGTDVPLHLTRFHPTYRLTNLPPTPIATLERAVAIARAEGLRYVYLGNVPGHAGASTVCPACGVMLIRRVAFQVLENRLLAGACPSCRTPIAGVWG